MKRVSEKCERYKLANQKLGQIIKNWEQEIDQLATTNKKLHDIAVGLENELETSKSKEKKFQALYREQKQKTVKIEMIRGILKKNSQKLQNKIKRFLLNLKR